MTEEYKIEKTGIDGLLLQSLKVIDTPDGDIMRMLRPYVPLMYDFPKGLGEIYFSEVLPGHVKAWKLHKLQNQLFAVPFGQMKIVVYDERADSTTLGAMVELVLGRPDAYRLLKLPAGLWYGFQALNNMPALLCNAADRVHDPEECIKLDANSPKIPYSWQEDRATI